MPRFNYIVTIHNKEDLIEKVLTGILISAGPDSHIYLVLDGCTDRTESVIDKMLDAYVGLPITKLFAADVHEILSINLAMRTVPQSGDGFNILIQDDVILRERYFEKKVLAIYEYFRGKIGLLSFRHGVNIGLDDTLAEITEIDVIESVFGQGMVEHPLAPGYATTRMVCLRSPECISFDTIRKIGLLNEKFAPYTYDDHDYGLRCLRSGLQNVIYALKTSSNVEWGGMRRSPQPGVAAIMKRNRRFVYEDHADFVKMLRRDDFLQPSVIIPVELPTEDADSAMLQYEENRASLSSFNRRRRFNIIRRLREKYSI